MSGKEYKVSVVKVARALYVTLPKELAEKLGVNPGDKMKMTFVPPDMVILEKGGGE